MKMWQDKRKRSMIVKFSHAVVKGMAIFFYYRGVEQSSFFHSLNWSNCMENAYNGIMDFIMFRVSDELTRLIPNLFPIWHILN